MTDLSMHDLIGAYAAASDEFLDADEAAEARITAVLREVIGTLPVQVGDDDSQYYAFMRRHGVGHGAGIGTVISAVRRDLEKLLEETDA